MTYTTQSMIVAAGAAIVLLVSISNTAASTRPRAEMSCVPAMIETTPPEYLAYHALVAPAPVVPSARAPGRSLHASCSQQKVIRT
jgi:hypothetical protein